MPGETAIQDAKEASMKIINASLSVIGGLVFVCSSHRGSAGQPYCFFGWLGTLELLSPADARLNGVDSPFDLDRQWLITDLSIEKPPEGELPRAIKKRMVRPHLISCTASPASAVVSMSCSKRERSWIWPPKPFVALSSKVRRERMYRLKSMTHLRIAQHARCD